MDLLRLFYLQPGSLLGRAEWKELEIRFDPYKG
jgi:hypothetical protein